MVYWDLKRQMQYHKIQSAPKMYYCYCSLVCKGLNSTIFSVYFYEIHYPFQIIYTVCPDLVNFLVTKPTKPTVFGKGRFWVFNMWKTQNNLWYDTENVENTKPAVNR